MKNKKSIIAISLCVIAIGLLIWLGLSKNLTYYRTVNEAYQEQTNKTFRLAGNVKPKSIKETSVSNDNTQTQFSFVVTNGEKDIKVEYANPLPELLKDGVPTVVEGKWNNNKTLFIASSVMVKHGSEYTPPTTAEKEE